MPNKSPDRGSDYRGLRVRKASGAPFAVLLIRAGLGQEPTDVLGHC